MEKYLNENIKKIVPYKLENLNYDIIILNKCNVIHNHSVSINKSYNGLGKYRILKKSQMYYLNNYAKCNYLSKQLIKLFSRIISTIIFLL